MIGLLHYKVLGPTSATTSDILSAPVAIGNRIVLGIGISVVAGLVPPTATDDLGNTYHPEIGAESGSGEVWKLSCISAFAGTPTITVVTAGAAARVIAAVFGSSAGWVDDDATDVAASDPEASVANSCTVPAVTNVSSSALQVAVCRTVSGDDVTFTGPTTPWTIIDVAHQRCAMAYRIVNAPSTNGVVFAWTGTDNGNGAVIAAYDEASGGSTFRPYLARRGR